MVRINSDKDLFDFVREARDAESSLKAAWQREVALDMNQYEGNGWMQSLGTFSNEVERLKVDLNPDSPHFRPTLNRTTALVQRTAVATQPIAIGVDVAPPERNAGTLGSAKAQADEDLLTTLIDDTGLCNVWGDANFMRSVIGCGGIGLSLRSSRRTLTMGQEQVSVPDCLMRAYSFLPLKLVLDPQIQDRDLDRHDYVVFQDVWTIHKVMRTFGPLLEQSKVKIDEGTLLQIGQLNCFELTINALTQNRLFSQYRYHSRTKGMVVTQVHRKDEYGRWGYLDVTLEPRPNEFVRLTKDDNTSPYGGCGLPFMLLHGFRRADSMYSIGDTRMLRDDQERLNRTQAAHDRQMINASKHQWVADRRGMGWVKSPKEQEKVFTNRVGGVIFYESGTRESPVSPPQLVHVPPPQSALREMIAMYEGAMKQQVHTAPGNFGELPTHVPAQSYMRALDEAGQVLDGRVHEDKVAGEKLLSVMLGTAKKLIQSGNPSTLGLLEREGFTTEDIMLLIEDDADYPTNRVSIRDGSIRMRSWNSKMQALDTALEKQAIDPKTYRRELALTLDSPLTADDKLFAVAFEKIARGVLLGETQFVPMPISNGMDLVETLERATVDPLAMRDPEARQRVLDAAMVQRGIMMQMAAEQAAMSGAGAGTGVQGQQQNQVDPTGQSFDQFVASLGAQGAAA